jgi:hypothetical protein
MVHVDEKKEDGQRYWTQEYGIWNLRLWPLVVVQALLQTKFGCFSIATNPMMNLYGDFKVLW